MIDQEQTTAPSETENLGASTTSTSPEAGSGTSTTTTPADDAVNLAATGGDADKDAVADGTANEDEDTRTDEEKAADAARAELFGAPAEDASYEIEGLPEGMAIDAEALDAVAPAFRELGLSNKGASKVAQVYAEKVLPQVQQRVVDGINADVVAQRTAWENESRDAIAGKGEALKNANGETISFDGKDVKGVMATAAKALDRLAPAGFREWLDKTGLSVHPMMVGFAYGAGKTLAEDTELEPSDTGSGKPMARTQKYYNR